MFSSLSPSFLLPRVDSPCLESTLGWGFLHYTHAVVLLESGSESIFFPLLYWLGARRDVGYPVSVYSREALPLWCYFIVVAVSRGLHRQRSNGHVIPSSVHKD